MNYAPTYGAHHSETLHRDPINSKTRFYEQQMSGRPDRSYKWGYGTSETLNSAMSDARQTLKYSTFNQSGGGSGAPRFKVSLVK